MGEIFSVCINLVRLGALEISCVWHSSLKAGPLLAPSPVTWLLFSPESTFLQIPHPHDLIITQGKFTWLLPAHPVSLELPIPPWPMEAGVAPFSQEVQMRGRARLRIAGSEPGPAGCLSARNPNTGQGCAAYNKPLQGCKTGQRSRRVRLCLDND